MTDGAAPADGDELGGGLPAVDAKLGVEVGFTVAFGFAVSPSPQIALLILSKMPIFLSFG